MKALLFRTYSTTPLGIKSGKWSHDRSYGTAGKSGWFVSVTFPWFSGRYQFQIRHDVY